MNRDRFAGLAGRLCDVHVHVGEFRDLYFAPETVVNFLKGLGLGWWVISALTVAPDQADKAVRELQTAVDLAPWQTIPALWVTPWMLEKSPDLKAHDVVPFSALKIHGLIHDWEPAGKPLARIGALAQERGIPVILHTGGRPESEAGAYDRFCAEFRDTHIILAHGRPIEQAIAVLERNENAWVDISFMELSDIRQLVGRPMEERVLFGTDYPVTKYYYRRQAEQRWYRRRVEMLIEAFGEALILKWANEAPKHCFHKWFSSYDSPGITQNISRRLINTYSDQGGHPSWPLLNAPSAKRQ